MSVYFKNLPKISKNKQQTSKITVKEKFEPEPVIFDSKEEFAEHVEDKREELNKLTTYKLNKMYQIDGYRITKIKGEISLIATRDDDKNDDQYTEVLKKLDQIIDLINEFSIIEH